MLQFLRHSFLSELRHAIAHAHCGGTAPPQKARPRRKAHAQAMLRFVLRDGFDYCSYVVKSVNEGIASLARRERTYSTDEVLKHARGATEKHGARFHKAA